MPIGRSQAHGLFLHDRETLVQAATEAGPGYWVMTPLRTDAGWTVLVNRGFVSADARDRAARRAGEPEGRVAVAGLLRISEPGGGFLHSNDPARDRWYSRDVAAIAAARGLGPVAPYYIDEGPTAGDARQPRGGLTILAFPNNHLQYALTWFALAGLAGFGAFGIRRRVREVRVRGLRRGDGHASRSRGDSTVSSARTFDFARPPAPSGGPSLEDEGRICAAPIAASA